jgi:hypothetical protein
MRSLCLQDSDTGTVCSQANDFNFMLSHNPPDIERVPSTRRMLLQVPSGRPWLRSRSGRPRSQVFDVEKLIAATTDIVSSVADAACVAVREALALPCPEIDFWVPRLLTWTLGSVGKVHGAMRRTALLDAVVALARVHFAAVLQQLLSMPMSPQVEAGLGAIAEDSQLLTPLLRPNRVAEEP